MKLNDSNEEMTLEDRYVMKHFGIGTGKNFAIFRDLEGSVLQAKENLVVRKGREMTMRKIFNNPGAIVGENQATLGLKSILLFGLGTGGTPLATPFAPYTPTASDADLATATPFRVSAGDLPAGDQSKYCDGRASSGTAANTDWYKKTFENGNGAITVNTSLDQVYNKLTLAVTAADARDKLVNELALYFAKYNASGVTNNDKYTEFFMFSRLTFQTESLPSTSSKGLNIDYFVYL